MDKNRFRFAAARAAAPIPQAPHRSSLARIFRRFRQNRGSVLASAVIGFLLLFAVTVPLLSPFTMDFRDGYYRRMPPLFHRGTTITGPQAVLDYNMAIGLEAGGPALLSFDAQGQDYYRLEVDTVRQVGFQYVDLTPGDFAALQAYQNETGRQVLYPIPKNHAVFYPAVSSSANLWYELADEGMYSTGKAARHDEKGLPILTPNYLLQPDDGSYRSLRLEKDPGTWVYGVKNQTGYRCRVLYEAYYRFRNGFPPRYLLGTNQHGQDILVSLAAGARLSFLLSLSVSALNLAIGLCYGAVEGFYGGRTDLWMERISDILKAVPFIVVATLFQLHLSGRVGAVPSLLFSFVLTGWIGIAARVRAQFYRYKSEEYVLCARTLGASGSHLIFRHILPNAIGTVITAAVLLIPGVIFSESMLSYLGIVNLESRNLTSIGTMLAGGRAYLAASPHIIAFPALFIGLLMISFNLFGNGLRDAFNTTLTGGD